MNAARELPRGSLVKGGLPRGCALCQKGAKMVLLVTGICASACYYCPLSEEKAGRDVIFADELRVRGPRDILLEARLIDAEGTGITGGDPLCAPKRTLGYIRLLKSRFGKGHHIHLYTAGKCRPAIMKKLGDAGLDEIRFHPPQGSWDRLESSALAPIIRAAIDSKMTTGVEVPAIPGEEKRLLRLAKSLDAMGAAFLNLNELEYSQTNYKKLNRRGFTVRDDISSGVLGSEKTARRVVDRFGGKMAIHYCSSGFKDGVQLRRRILRRAKNVARPYQVITGEGTLLTGIVEGPKTVLGTLRREFGVPAGLSSYNKAKGRAETSPSIARLIAPFLRERTFVIEEYPTADGLEVERRPL